ncbi:MAG: hypothetical protein LBE55_04745 [Clostridiales bacterium]|jgi:hypothetical protein|nr:hypothetical protein [Clostridiales bacterium]
MANTDKIQIYKNPRPHRYFPDPSVAQAFYSPDSAARQIAEAAPPEPVHYPEPERRGDLWSPAPRSKKRRKAKQQTEFIEDIQARHRHNLLSYVLVLAFFGGLALILALSARFEYDRVALEAAQARLVAMQSGNAARAGEIYAALDLEAIEAFAIEHLGMMPPEEFQMVEIVVSPQSFFASSPQDTPSATGFSFERFWNILFSFDAGYTRE